MLKDPDSLVNSIFNLAYFQASLPYLTFFLDIDPIVSQTRRTNRAPEQFSNNGQDRVELKGNEFLMKVRKNFLKRANIFSDRIKVINITSEMKPEDVLNSVISILKANNLL